MSDKDEEKKSSDKLTSDYRVISMEGALLTSFAGFLFGFLLNISIVSAATFDLLGRTILLVALFSITVSISLL